MTNHRTALLFVGVLMTSRALPAHAPVTLPPRPTQRFEAHTEMRQSRQQHRIAQGVQSGELAPREAAQLERQQVRIDRHRAHVAADGRVTPLEAARIHRQQDFANRRIYRKKHNAR